MDKEISELIKRSIPQGDTLGESEKIARTLAETLVMYIRTKYSNYLWMSKTQVFSQTRRDFGWSGKHEIRSGDEGIFSKGTLLGVIDWSDPNFLGSDHSLICDSHSPYLTSEQINLALTNITKTPHKIKTINNRLYYIPK